MQQQKVGQLLQPVQWIGVAVVDQPSADLPAGQLLRQPLELRQGSRIAAADQRPQRLPANRGDG
jgi:hypothetical protein